MSIRTVEHSREEVAQRAGVDPEDVDRLVQLGILTPAYLSKLGRMILGGSSFAGRFL